MREYQAFPVGAWVKWSRWIKGEKNWFTGWVEGYDGRRYTVYLPKEELRVELIGYSLWDVGIEEEVTYDLINFTLDQGKKEWFMELTGGDENKYQAEESNIQKDGA